MRHFGIAAGRPYTIKGRTPDRGAKSLSVPPAHHVSVDFTVLLFCLGVVLGYVLKAFAG